MKSNTTLLKLIHTADALVSSNKLDDAMVAYKKICKIDSKNPSAWLTLGSIAGNIGKYKEAEIAFKNATRLETTNGRSVELLAQAQEALGKNKLALNTLISHRSNGDKSLDILHRIAILYAKLSNFNDSIDCLNDYVAQDHTNPNAYHCLASAHEAIHNFDKATEYYTQALTLAPESHTLHNCFGAHLHKMGAWNEAMLHYKESLRIKPDIPITHYNIATLYYALGYYNKAASHHSIAIDYRPDFVEAILGLAKASKSLGNNDKSIQLYNTVLHINPTNSEAYANMGITYASLGDFDNAMHYLNIAHQYDPENIEITSEIVLLEERKGNFSKASERLKPLLISHPFNPKVALAYGAVSRYINEQDNAISHLEKSLDENPLTPPVKAELHYLLGKLYNESMKFDMAFKHYEIANNTQPDTYDNRASQESVQKRIKTYTRESLSALPSISGSNEIPIFIVGMPRSGTTLIEQIVSSHSSVRGAGELQHLTNTSNDLQKIMMNAMPEASELKNIKPEYIENIAHQYFKLSRISNQKEEYTTDKMPHNFLLLGIIQALFPNAKIIHSKRNPLDNCLSIYFSNLNALHPYAGRLDNIARYYTEHYQKLMTHWKETLDIEILDINYEDLVNDHDDVSKRIIDYCGLDWEDNCLKYYESSRYITTISYDQVRRPIYKSSIGRWKHYTNHIRSLKKHFG